MSSSSNQNSARKGKGRQKVDMVKIKNETNLQVTFSKRRAGLFKKASELSTLCGAETALVVFSPGNKAHSFGHSSVEAVTNRFLNCNEPYMSDADKLLKAHQNANINQQTLELNQIQMKLELEQQRKEELERVRKEGQRQRWCPPAIDKLDRRQLDLLKGALLRFQHQLETRFSNDVVPPSLPGSGLTDPGREASGRSRKSVRGRRLTRVRLDDRANGSDALLGAGPDATVQYDPMAADTCLTIPYSSTEH